MILKHDINPEELENAVNEMIASSYLNSAPLDGYDGMQIKKGRVADVQTQVYTCLDDEYTYIAFTIPLNFAKKDGIIGEYPSTENTFSQLAGHQTLREFEKIDMDAYNDEHHPQYRFRLLLKIDNKGNVQSNVVLREDPFNPDIESRIMRNINLAIDPDKAQEMALFLYRNAVDNYNVN